MSVIVAQLFYQVVDRLQQSTRISFHPIDGIPVYGRKRGFAISLQKLTHADNYIQRRAQFMAYAL
jgi:hypothetical protein